MLKIIVDAMGGDYAPSEIVKGAVLSLDQRKDFKVILTGPESVVQSELKKYKFDRSRVEVVNCTEVVTNDDKPTEAMRTKRDSSLAVAYKLLKEDDEAGGLVSAGSTGAVLTGGIMYLGRVKGVHRPAICPGLPNVRGTQTLICDSGANAECKPAYLAQFAVMASAYGKAAFGMENPKVGLLSNGTEEKKGDPLHQEAYALLKETKGINFVGNVEGRDIMFGDIDIAVCDGFSGNVALKSIEGCGKMVSTVLKESFSSSLGGKLAYLRARKYIGKLATALDYSRYGGAVFLGLKKVVIKSHGTSKAKSICPSVVQAVDACRGGLVNEIAARMEAEDVIGE